MRILHYADENNLAWAAPWIQLLKEMERQGAENAVLCRPGGTLEKSLKEAGIPCYTYTPLAQWLPCAACGIRDIIQTVRPDLIHTRLSSAARLGGYWGQKQGVPVISTFDKYPKAKYYRHSDVLVGCSSAVTDHVKTLDLPHARLVTTILNPVLAEHYTRDESIRQAHRKSLGVADDEILVLGMGRFVAWKAWDDYLRAIALVPSDLKMRFLLVGSGEEEAHLRKLASDLGVEQRVQFFPFAADVRPWLWAADVFVQTSKKPEGFSLMLIEAMAAGAVPLATNIGGTLDILKDAENGFMFSPGDAERLSALLREAIENTMCRHILAAAARASAEAVNVKNIARQTLSLYEDTLLFFKRR